MAEKKVDKLIAECVPLPMCMVDMTGKVSSASPRINEVFLYDQIEGTDIFALTGIKHEQFIKAAEEDDQLLIVRNDKTFRIIPSFTGIEEDDNLALYFLDVTENEQLREKYKEESTCIAIVSVDNYDELMASTPEEEEMELSSAIDKCVRTWASNINASVTKYKDHMFLLVLSHRSLEEQERSKFNILDKVKQIETEADFPVTLSIGIGLCGDDPAMNDIYADQALDLALGRGGDQTVVKNGNSISYFGGKTQTVEKSNKGKSRIIGHALCRLVEAADNVIIMGHSNPDMDAFGSAVGLYKLAKPRNKKTYILINKHNEALDMMYEAVKETEEYDIITNRKALNIVKKNTLVIVVDTHRPSITECPRLLEIVDRSVVIDHHRKAEEFITNPTLAYTEPYASSTSELVTEILQYTVESKDLTKLEAEALLAGITVDTNRFSVKTGVRTFEAAAWLKRAGADTTDVKRFFQTNLDTFSTRARCIADAQFPVKGVAMSICKGRNLNAQIINSQAADELLNIKDIQASFVAGMDEDGRTVVSARSLGGINVQLIMEKFGGGGHMNTAGAQMSISPEEAIKKLTEKLQRLVGKTTETTEN